MKKKILIASMVTLVLAFSMEGHGSENTKRRWWTGRRGLTCTSLVVVPALTSVLFFLTSDSSGPGYLPISPNRQANAGNASIPLFRGPDSRVSFKISDGLGKTPEKAFFNKTVGQRFIARAVNQYVRSNYPDPQHFAGKRVENHLTLSIDGIEFRKINPQEVIVVLYGTDFRIEIDVPVSLDDLQKGYSVKRSYAPIEEAPIGRVEANAYIKFHYQPGDGSIWIEEFYGDADISALGFDGKDDAVIRDVRGNRADLRELPTLPTNPKAFR